MQESGTHEDSRHSPEPAGVPTNMSASKTVSAAANRSPANIRIVTDQMDEWSILVRLQDFDAMKKRESEAAKLKQKQKEVLDMLNKQRQDLREKALLEEKMSKEMDKRMIARDRELFEQQVQKDRDREETARRQRAEMLEQEMQLKKLANYKKSDHAKAEQEREAVER